MPCPPVVAPGVTSSRLSVAHAAFALALLLGLQPVATDIYLPALPALTRDLAAPMPAAQLTMSGLILAFGIAQLVWGPVADRVGRRPVLLAGLVLYALAAAGSAAAGHIDTLVAWRVLQGVAVAATVVCARAMLRDLYEPQEGARVMSLAMSGLAVVAIGGPVLGGALAAVWGWRSTLAAVALCGLAGLLYVAWRVPETRQPGTGPASPARVLLVQWSAMLRHPVFVAWTLLTACTYGGLFTILAGSSFVYMDTLGLAPAAYGAALAAGSTSYLVGTFVCRRWVVRHGMAGTVSRAAGFTLAGGLAMGAAAAAGIASPWTVLLPHALFAFGHGMHQPCGQAGVTGPFPRAAGAAAALAGFALALVAFGVGRWLGAALDGSVRPLAYGVAFWSVATAAVAWLLVRRHARA